MNASIELPLFGFCMVANRIDAAIAALGEEQVYWQPLDMIGVIADLIDGMVDDSVTLNENFTTALAKPWVMDDATIDRALRLYTERVHFIRNLQ